jgi:hypothetical protein
VIEPLDLVADEAEDTALCLEDSRHAHPESRRHIITGEALTPTRRVIRRVPLELDVLAIFYDQSGRQEIQGLARRNGDYQADSKGSA